MNSTIDRDLYLYCLIFWVAGLGLTVFLTRAKKTPGVGLPALFLAMMFMNHWFGAMVCYLPWYRPDPLWNKPNHIWLTYEGFYQSTIGIAGFLVGCLGVSRLFLRDSGNSAAPDAEKVPRTASTYMKVGLASYILMAIGAGAIGSATSLLSAGFNLILVGMTLLIWRGFLLQKPAMMRRPLLLAGLFPLFTLLTQGFLGYGVAYLTIIAGFYIHLSGISRRWLLAPLVLYLGLSFYVTYMRDRGALRNSVWGQEAYSSRLEKIGDSFASGTWFDPMNNRHLELINARLNQNSLVGSSVQHIERTKTFAEGDTLWTAVYALIPRIIWPEKPISAGSGGLVTKYTGIKFAEGTSVAIGMILEFYVNFGTYFVFLGMLAVGLVLRALDFHAGRNLKLGDYTQYATCYLAGLSLLNVLGSFVEISVCFVAAIVVARLARRWIPQ